MINVLHSKSPIEQEHRIISPSSDTHIQGHQQVTKILIFTAVKKGGIKPQTLEKAGYGIGISKEDRDGYFHRDWDFVEIELENGEIVRVNLSNSFWNRCEELRSSKIGKWMSDRSYAPWPKGDPPKSKLIPLGERKLKLVPNID